MIYQFLLNRNGRARRHEIIEALGKKEEEKQIVREKISMMERFGIVTIKGDLVTIKGKQ